VAKKHGRKYGDLSPALPERGGSLPGERKNFIKNDNGFVCAQCDKTVQPLGSSSRDHCPFCLYSLHVDIVPGDRASGCGGLLVPLAAETDARRGYMIIYRCKKCGAIKRNKSAHDAKIQPDNIDLIIELTTRRGEINI
jgi:DNA-directed RNA polymerase subunit RPC12/RpoP